MKTLEASIEEKKLKWMRPRKTWNTSVGKILMKTWEIMDGSERAVREQWRVASICGRKTVANEYI